jgi:hypothetical protein
MRTARQVGFGARAGAPPALRGASRNQETHVVTAGDVTQYTQFNILQKLKPFAEW